MKLTRRNVAGRLGKSIATVRRLEGHVLHPQQDLRGVYWFDSDEVNRLRSEPERARPWSSSQWLRRRTSKSNNADRDCSIGIPAVLEACEHLVATARRGRFASRDELIVPVNAFSELLDALGLCDDDL